MDEDRVDDFFGSIYESLRTLIFDDSAEFNYPLDHQYKYIDDVNLYRTQLRRYASQLLIPRQITLRQSNIWRPFVIIPNQENFLEKYINVLSRTMERENTPKEDIIYASLQSFFVVELILRCTVDDLIEEDDPIFLRGETLQKAILNILMHTALPFEYLEEAFKLRIGERRYPLVVGVFMMKELCLGPIIDEDFGYLYYTISDDKRIGWPFRVDNNHPNVRPKHLLAFVHKMWVASSEFGKRAMIEKTRKRRRGRQRVIQNALELQRAGIRFKGVNRSTFDVVFRRGLLEIPLLSITAETCSFLQSVIAYEENSLGHEMLVVTDYCIFMDCLIQSPQDVQLLRESGVIESYLHDDKGIVAMFDKIGKRVPSSTHFYYSDLFDEVNKYCVQTWNSWKAKFRRNYFREDNQLEALSFMFAIYIILPVTILQTVYSVLSYYKGGG